MTPVDQVLRFLGEVVLYGGGSAAVAFLLFQYLGKGWIDARFAERLEAFKEGQRGHGIRGQTTVFEMKGRTRCLSVCSNSSTASRRRGRITGGDA